MIMLDSAYKYHDFDVIYNVKCEIPIKEQVYLIILNIYSLKTGGGENWVSLCGIALSQCKVRAEK